MLVNGRVAVSGGLLLSVGVVRLLAERRGRAIEDGTYGTNGTYVLWSVTVNCQRQTASLPARIGNVPEPDRGDQLGHRDH